MEGSSQETRRNATSRYSLSYFWHKGEQCLYAAFLKVFEDEERQDMERV